MSLPQMSVCGAVLIAVIVVVRALAIHRLPKRVFVLLWGVVLLRLLVPFSIPAPVSVYSFVPEHAPVWSAAGLSGDMSDFQAAGEQPPEEERGTWEEGRRPRVGAARPKPPVYVLIWLAGTSVCAIFFLVCYVHCLREFGMSLPVRNAFVTRWREEHRRWRTVQVRQSERIAAPLTYGVLRPVILMPKQTDWEDERQLSCVLLHEYVHICRLDALRKLLAAAALCIHWFNPMVWIMYVLLNKDIELSCDEGVVRRLGGEDARSTYARTLIAMEEKKSGLLPLYNHFSRNALEERITEIMRAKKVTVGISIVSIALVAVIAGLFATSARANDERDAALQASDDAREPDGDAWSDVSGDVEALKGDSTGSGDAAVNDDSRDAAADDKSSGSGEALADDGSVAESSLNENSAVLSERPSERLVYVESFDGVTLTFDEVEWVTVPGARAEELGFTVNDGPSGFVIYNETTFPEQLPLAQDCACKLLDWTGNYQSMKVTPEELKQILAEREGTSIPYQITVEDGEIVAVVEHYVP